MASFTAAPAFEAGHRLLVLAPHPDDETLVTGELLQRARVAGAEVRVVIATDGDDNPWPQRWIERRWHIDASARRRWGKRRREESLRALDVLGVPRAAVHHLGWGDGSLTGRLIGDANAEDELADVIATFAPTHVAVPVLDDRHPDHSALRVLAELAWATRRVAPAQRLGFVVHACARVATRTAAHGPLLKRKLEALGMHTSQLALSAKRMHGIAMREECFDTSVPFMHLSDGGFSLPLRGPHLRARELLIIATIGRWAWRGRLRLRHGSSTLRLESAGAAPLEGRIDCRRGRADFTFTGCAPECVFAKLHRRGRRLRIFDTEGWHAFGGVPVVEHP